MPVRPARAIQGGARVSARQHMELRSRCPHGPHSPGAMRLWRTSHGPPRRRGTPGVARLAVPREDQALGPRGALECGPRVPASAAHRRDQRLDRVDSPAGRCMVSMRRMDPVIEALKRDVDRTILRENLRLTPEQRALELMELLRAAEEFARAGRSLRGEA